MKQAKRLIPALLVIAIACATVGAGDTLVVRAEDALSNGLTVYSSAMSYHFANSTKESPEVYKAFESFRTSFPLVWHGLDYAKRQYQKDKVNGKAPLEAALNALSTLVGTITPLIGRL